MNTTPSDVVEPVSPADPWHDIPDGEYTIHAFGKPRRVVVRREVIATIDLGNPTGELNPLTGTRHSAEAAELVRAQLGEREQSGGVR